MATGNPVTTAGGSVAAIGGPFGRGMVYICPTGGGPGGGRGGPEDPRGGEDDQGEGGGAQAGTSQRADIRAAGDCRSAAAAGR